MNKQLLGIVLAAAFSAVLLPAQQPAAPTAAPAAQTPAAPPAASADQPADAAAPVIHVGVNEVNLIFTVTDKHGHYIPNLKQSDFALLDDQKAPARVNAFRQQINLPLRVGIVIDASTSIRTRFKFEQQSANEFLLQVLKAKGDRAFIMGFDVTPTVTQDWTNNLDALETGVNRLRPGGGTALRDAVYTACRDKLLDVARGQEPVRKAMVLLSDGDDNQSRVYLDEAVKMCQRSETIIYAISTNWTPSRGKGDEVLTQMAEATGGQVFFPPSVEEVSNSFHSIEEELRSQYALTYTPADFKYDGSFRPIYLFANDRHYQVRARKGYFAPRQ
ncbi:MAG: VWA domain-containing protein [Terracidiphilus sp.]|nr:VWA domain-containing protein [Terracidiphilus sp.]MDR3777203.1 VWA domain-containing protein [Terracidiphilus sp.]